MKAQALWFAGPRQAELREEEVPAPTATQVQVKSLCSLISAGSEMNFYRGEGNLDDLTMFPTAGGKLPFPLKFGYQEIGEVTAAGEDSGIEVGERLLCFHPHQSLFTMEADFGTKIPRGLDPARAAFAGLFGVALNSFLTTPALVGDRVAVSGLGVVGAFAGYLARLTASKVILIDPLPHRRTKAGWIGADAVVHPADAAEAVHDLTGGQGVDLFIEASGAPAALQQAIDLTAVEGTITVPGWYGTRPVPLKLSPGFHLRRHKIFSTGPSMNPALAPRWDRDRYRDVAWQHVARIDTEANLISHKVPFPDAPHAYALLDDPAAEATAVLLWHDE